jgi:hypothetical protein
LAIFSALEGLRFAEVVHNGKDMGPPLPELLGSYIEQRVGEGAFKQVNAQIVAQLFIETIFMYVADQQASISGPPLPFPDKEAVDTLVKIFLDGLKA